jgi:hypothetical protein
MNEVRAALALMVKHLGPGDRKAKSYLRSLATKTPQEIANDVNLWGGMGSIMDQSHIPDPLNQRVDFERAAIQLARALLAAGGASGRVQQWASMEQAPSGGAHDV